eukprot:900316-Amphidinium_carterae.5
MPGRTGGLMSPTLRVSVSEGISGQSLSRELFQRDTNGASLPTSRDICLIEHCSQGNRLSSFQTSNWDMSSELTAAASYTVTHRSSSLAFLVVKYACRKNRHPIQLLIYGQDNRPRCQTNRHLLDYSWQPETCRIGEAKNPGDALLSLAVLCKKAQPLQRIH